MSHDETTVSELIAFMQENMPMKQDLERFATKDDLMGVKSDVMTTIDRFAKLHETLDHELVAMRAKYERLEERLMAVERKIGV